MIARKDVLAMTEAAATATASATGTVSWSFAAGPAAETQDPAPRTSSTALMIVVPGPMILVQRYEYTGRELASESAEYFFRFRVYGPALGQFFTRDPLGYETALTGLSYVGLRYEVVSEEELFIPALYSSPFATWGMRDPLGQEGWFDYLIGKLKPDRGYKEYKRRLKYVKSEGKDVGKVGNVLFGKLVVVCKEWSGRPDRSYQGPPPTPEETAAFLDWIQKQQDADQDVQMFLELLTDVERQGLKDGGVFFLNKFTIDTSIEKTADKLREKASNEVEKLLCPPCKKEGKK